MDETPAGICFIHAIQAFTRILPSFLPGNPETFSTKTKTTGFPIHQFRS